MAGTIRVNLQVNIDNGAFSDSITVSNAEFVQTNIGGGNPGTLSIGTVEESVAFTELTGEGYVFLKNLDGTNYVQWGFATGVYGGRLKANEVALFRLEPGTTLYLKADTAACLVQINAYED